MSPAMAGTLIKKRSLRAKEKSDLRESKSFLTACFERDGKTAMPIATPNTPIGNCTRRIE